MALNYFGFNTKLVFSWQFAIRNLNSWMYDVALIFLSRYREKIPRIWDCCSSVTDIYIRRATHCFSFLFFCLETGWISLLSCYLPDWCVFSPYGFIPSHTGIFPLKLGGATYYGHSITSPWSFNFLPCLALCSFSQIFLAT